MKGKRATPAAKTSDAKAVPALVREYDDDFIVNAVPSEKKSKMNVGFNGNVETIEYKKHDFVQCSNRKPKGNLSRAQKQSLTCRTTQEIMSDQQWVLQAKLGMTRARAIGSISEVMDVDEVRIVLGPKSDIKLRCHHIDHLEDNPRAEICYEEVIPHVPGKYGRRDNIMCITMPIELKDRRFIMDSGRILFHQQGLIGWTLTHTRVQGLTSKPPMALHQLRLWWTWNSTRSMSLLRRMCWRTFHQCFHWGSDAWNKVTPLFGPGAENPT
jgi:hypothetical protein